MRHAAHKLKMVTKPNVLDHSFPFPFEYGYNPRKNLQTLTFLLTEIGVIMIKAIHIVLRYAIHLYDLNHTGLWEHKGRYVSHFPHVTDG